MQYTPPTSEQVTLIAMILRSLEQSPAGDHDDRPFDVQALKSQLIGLRLVVRKVEAKILGQIEAADWERLNLDLVHTKEALDQVLAHVRGSPWEGFENGHLTPVQE